MYDNGLGIRIGTNGNDNFALQHPFISSTGWKRFVVGGNLWWENSQWNYGAGGSNGFAAVMGRGNDGLGFYTKATTGNFSGTLTNHQLETDHLKMVITPAGRVGIGVSGPEEKLHVKGTSTITADIGTVTTSHWNTGSHTLELQNNDGGDVVLSFHRSGYSNASIKHSQHQGLIFTGNGSHTANHFHILKDGQVGVGTSTVGTHRLAVEGSIGAREVKVEASGWSDFVFAPDYDLKSLEEVETFIFTNQHLPGIPSAAEVKDQGTLLGEMSAKLLEKIEELTLYLIEQKKQLAKQQIEIEELKASISEIKSK